MKWSASAVGHTHVWPAVKFARADAVSHAGPMLVMSISPAAASASRISGCLISPPRFAVLAMSARVSTEKSSTAASAPPVGRARRRSCHSDTQEAKPVSIMPSEPSTAAS